MLPSDPIMANGDVLKQLQRILDNPETTIPANVTAQLLFAAIIELSRRVDNHGAEHQAEAKTSAMWRDNAERRLSQIESTARASDLLDAERDKVRVTIPDIFRSLIQPVIVSLVTAIVVGAVIVYITGGPP